MTRILVLFEPISVTSSNLHLAIWKSAFSYLKKAIQRQCDALRDLVSFVQLKKREQHPWTSVSFSKSNTLPWVFLTFFKLYRWNKIAQRIVKSFRRCQRDFDVTRVLRLGSWWLLPSLQGTVYLVTLTEEILNGKLCFLRSEKNLNLLWSWCFCLI